MTKLGWIDQKSTKLNTTSKLCALGLYFDVEFNIKAINKHLFIQTKKRGWSIPWTFSLTESNNEKKQEQ